MNKNSKIYIAGHRGLVGSALLKKLLESGYKNIIIKTKDELNLINQEDVKKFFEKEKPEYVFLCAAKVGSLYSASIYRAEFLYENTMIEYNVIHSSFENDVVKLILFSSADIYSKDLNDPYKEDYLTHGRVDFDAESFVTAKLSGVKMCESYNSQYGTDFITLVSANLYGEQQSYSDLNATVVPALIKRIHEAKEKNLKKVKIWGSGKAVRNFIYVEDLAIGSIFLMQQECDKYLYNIAYPQNTSIKQLGNIIKNTIGYKGILDFDEEKPEGINSKRLDTKSINSLGFVANTALEEGIKKTYHYFLSELKKKNIKLKTIKRVEATKKDMNAYRDIQLNTQSSYDQPQDYKDIVVLKPWGYEFLIYENSDVAIWLLHIKNGFSTSMHSHPNKKTSLVVLDGKAYCHTFSTRNYLDTNEALIIEKGVFHTTKSLSKNGLCLLEIESPPDKTDLVRLKDRYGRQNNGYECKSEMRTDNLKEDYNYFTLFEKTKHILKNKMIVLECYTQATIKNFKTFDSEILISLEGTLYDASSGDAVIQVGDAAYGYKFFGIKNFTIKESKKISLLRIKDTNEKK